ncbi:MAG: hypothetical protein K2N61_06885 [Lachnospiraceae bacterium]|nr:hypothetical protein [Lachnospiraceae bacterium]
MTEEYILKRDVIHDHSERMENIKRYYPYFRLIENDFSQYQGGKYEMLDMGYILMAVLRFFIEENNFKEKDVTYEEYSSFIKEIYERDFGLRLEKAEEQSLSLYIFDKIRNEGKPFIYQYFDPEEKKKKSIRIRLIESRIKNEAVYYYLTGEAVEFYLETKEIKDESMINISQILLTKMISTKNFRGGIEVVRRINHQVIRLKMRYNEVLELLSHDVFAGIKAYEKFMENVVKWFGEEQRMFHKNMELINETLKRADQPGGEIYFLEMELKRALVNHSELLDACTRLQIQADEMISKAKFSKLKQSFDFQDFMQIVMEKDDTSVLQYFIAPLLKLHIKKSFGFSSLDRMLTLRQGKEETGEEISENQEEKDYISDDEAEQGRIRENYILFIRLLFYYISIKEEFEIREFIDYTKEILGETVLSNSDFYSMLAHLTQKRFYQIENVIENPDTFFEEYITQTVKENPQYRRLKFMLEFTDEELQVTKDCIITNFRIIKSRWKGV